MRDSAQGSRERGDWLRAVGGLSLQSRHVVPEGCEALPAGLASRSADDGVAAGYVLGVGIQPAAVRGGHQPCRRRDRPHSADPRRRRHRRPRRRQPDDREDLSARQVRARLPEDAVHRLQRPAVHGQRRRREQEGVRHRSHDESMVRHGRDRRDLGRWLERGRVLAHHHELHLAGARAGREDHRPGSSHHARGPDLRFVPAR